MPDLNVSTSSTSKKAHKHKKTKKNDDAEPPAVNKSLKLKDKTMEEQVVVETGTVTWPTEDIKKLFSIMNSHIPKNDHLSYMKRASKLSWDQIFFDNYSSKECQEVWGVIVKKIRSYRLLGEVLEDALKWADEPWTSFYASKAKNRNPDLPKKPMSPYFLFMNDVKYVRKEFPTDMKAYSKKIQELYGNLSNEQKEKYRAIYEANKQEYSRKMELFLLKHPKELPLKKVKPVREKNISAFQLYVNEQLKNCPEHDSNPTKELIKTFKKQWEGLSISEKLPWFNLLKEKFPEMALKQVKTKQRKLLNTYSLFCQKYLKSDKIKQFPPKERMSQISILYKALKPEEITELKRELEIENLRIMEEISKSTEATEVKPKKKSSKKKDAEVPAKKPEPIIEIEPKILENNKIKKKKKSVKNDELEQKVEVEAVENGESPKKHKKKKKAASHDMSDLGFYNISAIKSDIEEHNESTVTPKKNKRKREEDVLPENLQEVLQLSPRKKKKMNSETEDVVKLNLYPGEPEAPPEDPFGLFTMEKRKKKNHSLEKLTNDWNSLDKSDRKNYKKKFKALKSDYMEKYQHFISTLSKKDLKKYLKNSKQV